jgi:methylated-DNA-[protein]-cysteine S-methyltransferase
LRSPIGTVLLVSDETALRALDFQDYEHRLHTLLRRQYGAYELIAEKGEGRFGKNLSAYFAGEICALDGIPVQTGGTGFQRNVWVELRRIPPGRTITYGQLAVRIGRPAAVRAVGHANGTNPVSIVVPCHRVVGTNGALTGYGGGLARKEWLLRHERAALLV